MLRRLQALPHVFAAMAGDSPALQQQACYALDSFCEHLGAPGTMHPPVTSEADT